MYRNIFTIKEKKKNIFKNKIKKKYKYICYRLELNRFDDKYSSTYTKMINLLN